MYWCQLTIARANLIRVPLSLAEVMMRGHHVALVTVGGAVSSCYKEIADVLLTVSRTTYNLSEFTCEFKLCLKIR